MVGERAAVRHLSLFHGRPGKRAPPSGPKPNSCSDRHNGQALQRRLFAGRVSRRRSGMGAELREVSEVSVGPKGAENFLNEAWSGQERKASGAGTFPLGVRSGILHR